MACLPVLSYSPRPLLLTREVDIPLNLHAASPLEGRPAGYGMVPC